MHRLATPFEPPPVGAASLTFETPTDLAQVREFVCECARSAGLAAERLPALRVAISEVATNTLRHTDAGGIVRVWVDQDAVISELTDTGTLESGPRPDRADGAGGWGLRIADEVCDRVDLYCQPGKTVWRLVLNLHGCA